MRCLRDLHSLLNTLSRGKHGEKMEITLAGELPAEATSHVTRIGHYLPLATLETGSNSALPANTKFLELI